MLEFDIETFGAWLELLLIGITALFILFELHQTRMIKSFEVYQDINHRYSDHLWKATIDPSLNEIWNKLDADRLKKLEKSQANGEWGAWYSLSEKEARQYRYTRLAFEIFEEAHFALEQKLIKNNNFSKWQNAVRVWTKSRWFKFVYADSKPRLRKEFRKFIERQMLIR